MKSEIPIRTWRWLGVNEIDNLPEEIREIHVNSNETISIVDTNPGRIRVTVEENAHHSKCSVNCDSLMLDDESRSDTIPTMDIEAGESDIGHEAKIGRISDDAIFYLTSRGIDENEARAMIVRGFVEPIAKELPLEYAVEMNRLINLELEGAR